MNKYESPYRAPPPQQTPRGAKPHFKGPFTCEMACSIALKLGAQKPDHLYAGLLVQSPDADGGDYREIAGGWPRHPVRIVGRSSTHWTIAHPLLFEVPPQDIASLGLFDQPEAGGGRLWFYGALRATLTSNQPESRFEFPAFTVLLKRPPIAAAVFSQ